MNAPRRIAAQYLALGVMLGAAPCRAQDIRPLPKSPALDSVAVIVGRGVTATVGSVNIVVPPTGDDSVFLMRIGRNEIVRYRFVASPGFRNIQVRGGSTDGTGRALPPAGALEGSGARYLSATSDLIVHIRKENRRLYELTKSMYAAEDPVPGYREVFCEEMRLFHTLGDSLSSRLSAEVTYVLEEEWPPYWDRFHRAQPALHGLREPPRCEGDVEKMRQKVRG